MLVESTSEMLLGTLERFDNMREQETAPSANIQQQIADKITANEVNNGKERNI